MDDRTQILEAGEKPNRLEEYKSRSVICDQETRRLQLLLDQKRRKEKAYNEHRPEFLFSNDEEEFQKYDETGEPMEWTTAKPKKPRLKDMFMLSEWMVSLPDDFERKWMFVFCPVGKRCLVHCAKTKWMFGFCPVGKKYSPHCAKGQTSVYGKRGQRYARFQSALPNGGQKDFTGRYSNSEVTILDCIWSAQCKSYFILDLLSWKGQFCMDTEMSFRIFWIKSKLEEMPQLSERSEFNAYPFVLLKYYPCDVANISEQISQHPYFPANEPQVDGILFYHSEAYYTPGCTPLVLWLKPFMLPEVLGIVVPDAYEQMKPFQYSTKEDFILEFEKRKKKRRHKNQSHPEETEVMNVE